MTQLKDGYIISGNVSDGVPNPIVKAQMVFYTGKCDAPGTWYGARPTNSNGDYCLAVEGGDDYYVKTDVRMFQPTYPYVDEWYQGPDGTTRLCPGGGDYRY